MATKKDLLNILETYDKATLERLVKYADLMLIPQADMLVTVTADQMVDRAHQLADIFFPEWTDRGKADFGEFLIEVMANFSEKDFWYINALANETLIENMTVYSNAYGRALSLGYIPKSIVNSVYRFKISFDASLTLNDTVIPIGGLIIEASTQGFKFTNANSIFVKAQATTVDVDLVQGDFATQNILYNGKSVRLATANIDPSYLYMTVLGDEWTQVITFSESDSTDKVYTSLPNENGSQNLKFGGDGFGYAPALGETVTIRYQKGDASAANGLPITTTYTARETPRIINQIIQVKQTVLGVEQESLESVKVNAPLFFRTRGRVLNIRDCIEYLESLSTVVKAQALAASNQVYFYVIPEEIMTPQEEDAFLTSLELELKENPVLGFTLFGFLTQKVNLNYDFSLPTPSMGVGGIDLDAFILSGYSLVDTAEEIKLLIGRFTDPRGDVTAYGKNFSLSELSSYLISNVEGLQNIVFNEVGGLLPNTLINGEFEVLPNEILEEILEANMTVNVQYSA